MIEAPWTAEQVDALNRFQRSGIMHPFTCLGHDAGDRDLIATRSGWICCHCDYAQKWAHEFMFKYPPPSKDDCSACRRPPVLFGNCFRKAEDCPQRAPQPLTSDSRAETTAAQSLSAPEREKS